jgi:hypothetical protein
MNTKKCIVKFNTNKTTPWESKHPKHVFVGNKKQAQDLIRDLKQARMQLVTQEPSPCSWHSMWVEIDGKKISGKLDNINGEVDLDENYSYCKKVLHGWMTNRPFPNKWIGRGSQRTNYQNDWVDLSFLEKNVK